MHLCRQHVDGRALMLFLALSLPFLQAWTTTTTTTNIVIAPPRKSHEWKQIAAIEVDTFDDFNFWEIRERKATERFVMQQYVETSKRMKGNKYALLVATESSRDVVGMVEMGVSIVAGTKNVTRTTIGVLCVSQKRQKLGVGALLLERCEKLALSEGWNEAVIFVEVEPENTAALSFFTKRGFERLDEDIQLVKVRRRRQYEERPHILLSKDLNMS